MSNHYVYLQEFNSVVQPMTKYWELMLNDKFLSLPRYELIGQHSFKDRQELIEGKDFEFDEDYTQGTGAKRVAIPTQGKQTVDEECERLLKEIEMLKALIKKAHDAGYYNYEKYSNYLSWLGFKTDNNL